MGLIRSLFKNRADRPSRRREAAENAKLRADVLFQHGNLIAATSTLQEAVALDPTYVDALVNLGYLLREQGQFDQSELILLQSLRLAPDYWPTHYNLGLTAEAQEEHSRAASYFARVLELEPGHIDALIKLYDQRQVLNDHAAARDLVLRAQTSHPSDPQQRSNLAAFLDRVGLRDEALQRLRKIMQECPVCSAARTLGSICQEMRALDEAQRWYEKAIELDPHYHQPRWDLALLRLLRGDFERGWPEFEASLPGVRGFAAVMTEAQYLRQRLTSECAWKGESLAGKRLLVWTEFGLGDSVMMMRFLPLLKDRWQPHSVGVLCEPALSRLMGTLSGVDRIINKPANPAELKADYDVYCSLLCLPARFNVRPQSLPAAPYLAVAQDQRALWQSRLNALGAGVKVGLCWAGGKLLYKNHLRSLPLAQFAPLFDVFGIHWISLQQGEPAREVQQLGLPLHDWMSECRDFYETAALIAALDLVISADTAIAHLAGAMGVPIWLLNRFESEWRWQINKEESAWYPTMRIFNQAVEGDWTDVISRIRDTVLRYPSVSARAIPESSAP